MNVYNLELVRNNEIRNYVTHKQDVLSVYCWHVILFDIHFFIMLMFVYVQKLLHCLIIYSYKTNPSFSPCPWNLRSIGPSDLKKNQTLIRNPFAFPNLHSHTSICKCQSSYPYHFLYVSRAYIFVTLLYEFNSVLNRSILLNFVEIRVRVHGIIQVEKITFFFEMHWWRHMTENHP